jgi:hypothetical protein
LKALRITTDDLEKYLEEEREYLEEVDREVIEDATLVSAEYAELLEKLAMAK